MDELPEMDVLPEAIPSPSGGVRTGRDAGRPSKSRSDRTSVRAVNPAKAINVQTFFSCMCSPSAAPARHQDSTRTTPPGGSSINTLQSWDVPADNGASTHRHASSNPAPEPQRRAATLSRSLSSSTPAFECTANLASSDASRDRARRSLPTNRMSFFRHGMIAE